MRATRTALLLLIVTACSPLKAQTSSPAPTPSLEQRVADLEAYVNNSARVGDISSISGPGPGHNGWLMTCAALVLFMTLPGLALFYGGLVRRKNVLSVLAQCLGIAGLVSILWWAVGYSLVFSRGFAVIPPALIIGAVAERMRFSAVIVFVAIWMCVIYFPIAHMVWGIDGCMNGVWNPAAKIHAIDFAGGTVVHMSSGWSALVLCVLLGHRLGFGKE